MDRQLFRLIVLKEAKEFLASLSEEAQEKISLNIRKVCGGEKNPELFKKLKNTDIWEFRTTHKRIAYRLFAFWDKDRNTLIVATNGIIKKTQKTPSKEIAKAEEIRRKYFEAKKG